MLGPAGEGEATGEAAGEGDGEAAGEAVAPDDGEAGWTVAAGDGEAGPGREGGAFASSQEKMIGRISTIESSLPRVGFVMAPAYTHRRRATSSS